MDSQGHPTSSPRTETCNTSLPTLPRKKGCWESHDQVQKEVDGTSTMYELKQMYPAKRAVTDRAASLPEVIPKAQNGQMKA